MPALEDDGFVVADSHGCLTYRVRKYGKDAWLPPDPEDMGKMAEWMSNPLMIYINAHGWRGETVPPRRRYAFR